jgi:hypothetical protein
MSDLQSFTKDEFNPLLNRLKDEDENNKINLI